MKLLQLILLAIFAVAIVFSFIMRLRMGALNGAIARGEQKNDAEQSADRYFHYAVRSAVVGGVAIVLCILAGIFDKL